MIPPAEVFRRMVLGCLLGIGLGIVYGFLRPLRLRRTHFADLLFVAAAFVAWLYLSFDICDADLRIGYTATLFIGCVGWELTFGKWLRPAFFSFWKYLGKICRFSCAP